MLLQELQIKVVFSSIGGPWLFYSAVDLSTPMTTALLQQVAISTPLTADTMHRLTTHPLSLLILHTPEYHRYLYLPLLIQHIPADYPPTVEQLQTTPDSRYHAPADYHPVELYA